MCPLPTRPRPTRPRSPLVRAWRAAPRAATCTTACAAVCAAAACRRAVPAAPPPAPALDAGAEHHCWSAAFRTVLPPESVAVRSARAYAALGLAGARQGRLADTAWAESAPTLLTRGEGARVYAARVVAFRRGDTTLFRPFVAARLLAGDAAARARAVESGSDSRALIGLCGDLGRTAQNGGTAPRADERDDSLPQWRRRP